MTDSTYSNRSREIVTVKSVSGEAITTEDGWGFFPPVRLTAGRSYVFEFLGCGGWGGRVVGIATEAHDWLYRHSDQDIERQDQEWREKRRSDNEDRLAANKAAWREREKALPIPLRQRLINFREHGGRSFDLSGWGYELAVSELAVLYQLSGGDDSPAINSYDREQGCSGNQHDYAKQLAKMLDSAPERVGTTVSALTPITGDPYYEKQAS